MKTSRAHHLVSLAGAFLLASIAAGGVAPASAAATGIAYDTVVKVVHTEHPILRRGDFAVDAKAAHVQRPYCEPSLVRRYITTDRERIEDVCMQQATIVDCGARTAAILDLQHKTYSIISLDAANTNPDYLAAVAQEKAVQASVKMSTRRVIARQRLGLAAADGIVTDVYAQRATLELTAPHDFEGLSTNDTWTYYFSPTPLPALSCIDAAAPWMSLYGYRQAYAPEIGGPPSAQKGPLPPLDEKTTESGPAIPAWRIPLFGVGTHMQHQGNAHYETDYFEIESGNVRPVQIASPMFTVPAEFTKSMQP